MKEVKYWLCAFLGLFALILIAPIISVIENLWLLVTAPLGIALGFVALFLMVGLYFLIVFYLIKWILIKFRDNKNRIWNFLKHPLNLIITITCLVVVTYFGIKIYNEIRPKSLEERKMECLKFGSNSRAAACIRLLK